MTTLLAFILSSSFFVSFCSAIFKQGEEIYKTWLVPWATDASLKKCKDVWI